MDPLGQLLASLDAPQLVLLARVLEDRLERHDARDRIGAISLMGSIKGIAALCQGRAAAGQRRASSFALDRVCNAAQIASAQAEEWEIYTARHEIVDDVTLSRLRDRAEARHEALSALAAILRRGDATPLRPNWAEEYPPGEDEEDRLAGEADAALERAKDERIERMREYIAQGGEHREESSHGG